MDLIWGPFVFIKDAVVDVVRQSYDCGVIPFRRLSTVVGVRPDSYNLRYRSFRCVGNGELTRVGLIHVVVVVRYVLVRFRYDPTADVEDRNETYRPVAIQAFRARYEEGKRNDARGVAFANVSYAAVIPFYVNGYREEVEDGPELGFVVYVSHRIRAIVPIIRHVSFTTVVT